MAIRKIKKRKTNPIGLATLADIAAAPFQDIIEAMEQKVCGQWMPGTTLMRVLVDNTMAESYGLQPRAESNGRWKVWCFSIGRTGVAKLHFYGWDIEQAVTAAWKVLMK